MRNAGQGNTWLPGKGIHIDMTQKVILLVDERIFQGT